MSDYYHDDIHDFLADDIVSIKDTYDIPIILLLLYYIIKLLLY